MFDECGGDSEAKDVVAMGDAVHAASEEHEARATLISITISSAKSNIFPSFVSASNISS